MLYAMVFILAFFCYAEPATAPSLSFGHDAEIGLLSDDCPVCFMSLSDPTQGGQVALICGAEWQHVFHKKCIDTWMSRSSAQACPTCRRPIVKAPLCSCGTKPIFVSKEASKGMSLYPREPVDLSFSSVRRTIGVYSREMFVVVVFGLSIFACYRIMLGS